jgi:transposase
MSAVRDHGQPRVEDPARLEGVAALGVDETKFLAATRTRRTRFITGFVDLDRARLLDVVPGRSGRAVESWLGGRPQAWLDDVSVVALDAFRGYANGLAARLGHATMVVDHFHAVRLANQAIDDVRRRVQQVTLGHRGRKADPLYGARRLLLVGHERLDPKAWQRLGAALAAGDPNGEVLEAWGAKERLRAVYSAPDPASARRRLTAFYQHCAAVDVPELHRLARTIDAWSDAILAYHHTGLSNGPTEAVNLLIEKVRRVGHGFRNLDNYRLRLLLRCGVTWHTQPTARIRARQPRKIA